jgi:hypothetical protein
MAGILSALVMSFTMTDDLRLTAQRRRYRIYAGMRTQLIRDTVNSGSAAQFSGLVKFCICVHARKTASTDHNGKQRPIKIKIACTQPNFHIFCLNSIKLWMT